MFNSLSPIQEQGKFGKRRQLSTQHTQLYATRQWAPAFDPSDLQKPTKHLHTDIKKKAKKKHLYISPMCLL